VAGRVPRSDPAALVHHRRGLALTTTVDTRIRRALERCLALGEVGIQVAAYLGEELIVDAWIGEADPDAGIPVTADTLFPCFSVCKAITATALHLQAERGLVDYDAPVARYWPEFAQNGKDTVTLRHVLSHRSGVPHLPAGTTVERFIDWDWMTEGIAGLSLLASPGTKSSYQAMSFGWIVGEIVQRTDPLARGFGRFVRDELCAPLGIDDLWIGLPPEEEHRVAKLVSPDAYRGNTGADLAPLRAIAMPVAPSPDNFNLPEVHQACIPAANGIMTARAQARFWALLANRGELDGVRLLPEGSVWSYPKPRPNPDEFDQVIGVIPLLGENGYWIGGPYPPAEAGIGSGRWIVSHPGGGGSIGWADIEHRLAVAFCHNRMFSNFPYRPWGDHPHAVIGDAIRELAGITGWA
jgi:CubicO group peptidase (beta-lactamase class C family)